MNSCLLVTSPVTVKKKPGCVACNQPCSVQSLPGRLLRIISCGYLPLLEQCSLTLSINYFITQPCPCSTPINSNLATLHRLAAPSPGSVRNPRRSKPTPGSSDPIVPCAQVSVRSNQMMNSPLNQYYVTCMLVSRPIEDTTRYRG